MDIKIFHSINYGQLMPCCMSKPKIDAAISAKLNKMPSSLNEAEQWLVQATKKYESIEFPAAPLEIPEGIMSDIVYTPIIKDAIPTELPITSLVQTPNERFYNAIIRWEGYRIMETLIRNANCHKDDDLTTDEVRGVMKYLKSVSSNSAEIIEKKIHPELSFDYDGTEELERASDATRRIYRFLYQYACKLYYEVATAFSDLLSDEDVTTVKDFYNEELGIFPEDFKLEAFVETIGAIHSAQKAIASGTVSKNNLLNLYQYRTRCSSIIALEPVIAATEDALYEYGNLSYAEAKATLGQRIVSMHDAREILLLIENEIEKIISFGFQTGASKSVASISFDYLQEQKSTYTNNIGQSFVPIVKAGTRQPDTSKITPLVKNPDYAKQKQVARKIVEHFSGVDKTGQQIMSMSDYALMLQYIDYLIENGTLPDRIEPIISMRLNLGHVQHTFYLIHDKLYGIPPVNRDWIHFIIKVFDKFKDKDENNIYRKWATSTEYDRDMKAIKKLARKK